MFKCFIKTFFINSSHFAFLIINIKILFNFKKECCTFGKKKDIWKKKMIIHSWGLNVLNMQKHFLFVSSFEHVNFEINEKYSKKNIIIQNIMFPLWFFKYTKMQFKKVSTHLGGSYRCFFTQKNENKIKLLMCTFLCYIRWRLSIVGKFYKTHN